jgi:hypothetical protein
MKHNKDWFGSTNKISCFLLLMTFYKKKLLIFFELTSLVIYYGSLVIDHGGSVDLITKKVYMYSNVSIYYNYIINYIY